MKRACTALALLLALLALAACGGGAPTPEAALLSAPGLPASYQNLQIAGTRQYGNRAIVLYRGVQPASGTEPATDMFGYGYLSRSPLGWSFGSGGAGGSNPPPEPAALIDYGVGTFRDGLMPVTVVYGQVLDPQVAAVEAQFADGSTARDTVTGGVFAIRELGTSTVCALRALDAQGTALRDFDAPGGGC